MSDCYKPDWDKGPKHTDGKPEGYLCERDGDHEGDHGWDMDYDGTMWVTWPVGEEDGNGDD